MDIPVKFETPRLVCTNCSFPLEVSGSAAKICCPRCNSWMDVDPACFGSCLKCHKTRSEEQTACLAPSLANSKNSNEISLSIEGTTTHRTWFKKFSFLLLKARDYLSGKVFL